MALPKGSSKGHKRTALCKEGPYSIEETAEVLKGICWYVGQQAAISKANPQKVSVPKSISLSRVEEVKPVRMLVTGFGVCRHVTFPV